MTDLSDFLTIHCSLGGNVKYHHLHIIKDLAHGTNTPKSIESGGRKKESYFDLHSNIISSAAAIDYKIWYQLHILAITVTVGAITVVQSLSPSNI